MKLQLLLNSLILFGLYLLPTIGFLILYNSTRFFNLAHGAMFSVGGYTAYLILKSGKGGIWLPALGAFLGGALLGFVSEKFIFRPLRERGSGALMLLLASFAVLTLVLNFLNLVFGGEILILPQEKLLSGFSLKGLTGIQIFIITLSIILGLGISALVELTPYGALFRAVSENRALLSTYGINPERVILMATFLGGGLAGLGGFLASLETNIYPFYGFEFLLKAMVAMIIGGVGRYSGTFVGVALVALGETFFSWFISAQWKDAFLFLSFLIFLIVRPHGLLGRREWNI